MGKLQCGIKACILVLITGIITQGIDYEETFALVVKIDSIQLYLVIATTRK